MTKSLIACLVILFLCSAYAQPYNYGAPDAILLDQVQALTFSKGRMTTGRRNSPIPQLQCVGGTASGEMKLAPSAVQCRNVGSDGFGNVQWKCEADLDSSVRFGETVVSCEGYSHPDDPYILKGSCGLEYTLDYTEQGRQNREQHYGHSSTPYSTYSHTDSHSGVKWGTVIMWVVIGLIAYGLFTQLTANSQRTSYGSTGGNPPPPYPGSGNYAPNAPGYGTHNSYGSYPGDPSCNPTFGSSYGTGYGTQNTWRPGFWSGLGTGGLMGYLFNRPRTHGYGTYVQPTARSSWGSGGSGFSHSSPRTATAFAGTRRR